MASSLLAILRTRIELAAVELQEEALRLLTYLILSLIALFCIVVTFFLGIILVIALFWETHRILVIVGLMVFFGGFAALMAAIVRYCYRRKPKLLAYTRQEISRDIDKLNSSN